MFKHQSCWAFKILGIPDRPGASNQYRGQKNSRLTDTSKYLYWFGKCSNWMSVVSMWSSLPNVNFKPRWVNYIHTYSWHLAVPIYENMQKNIFLSISLSIYLFISLLTKSYYFFGQSTANHCNIHQKISWGWFIYFLHYWTER